MSNPRINTRTFFATLSIRRNGWRNNGFNTDAIGPTGLSKRMEACHESETRQVKVTIIENKLDAVVVSPSPRWKSTEDGLSLIPIGEGEDGPRYGKFETERVQRSRMVSSTIHVNSRLKGGIVKRYMPPDDAVVTHINGSPADGSTWGEMMARIKNTLSNYTADGARVQGDYVEGQPLKQWMSQFETTDEEVYGE